MRGRLFDYFLMPTLISVLQLARDLLAKCKHVYCIYINQLNLRLRHIHTLVCNHYETEACYV